MTASDQFAIGIDPRSIREMATLYGLEGQKIVWLGYAQI